MPGRGDFEQANNAQAAVEPASLLIVGNHASQQSSDKQELEPALNRLTGRERCQLRKVTAFLSSQATMSSIRCWTSFSLVQASSSLTMWTSRRRNSR